MAPDTAIPFARPFIGREEEAAALRVIRMVKTAGDAYT